MNYQVNMAVNDMFHAKYDFHKLLKITTLANMIYGETLVTPPQTNEKMKINKCVLYAEQLLQDIESYAENIS